MATPWVNEPDAGVRDRIPTDLPPLPEAARDEDVDGVPGGENGEPIVPIPPELDVLHVYTMMPLKTVPPVPQLRQGVIDRLLQAQAALPEGVTITVFDGWRTREFQGELLAYYREQSGEALDGYVSDPTSTTRMPPHVTGGAVDLTLAIDGVPVAMGTDFDSFDEAAHLRALDDVPDDGDPAQVLDRDLRRLLGKVLLDAGLAPYPLEWWHWSYGEQFWAVFRGEERTVYSPTD